MPKTCVLCAYWQPDGKIQGIIRHGGKDAKVAAFPLLERTERAVKSTEPVRIQPAPSIERRKTFDE